MMPLNSQKINLKAKIDQLTEALELQNKNLEAERQVQKKLSDDLEAMAAAITDLESRHRILKYTTATCCGIAVVCVGFIAIPITIPTISDSKITCAIIGITETLFSFIDKDSSIEKLVVATNLSKPIKR